MAKFYPRDEAEYRDEMAKYGTGVPDGIKEKCGYDGIDEYKQMGYDSYEDCVRDNVYAGAERVRASRKILDNPLIRYDSTLSPKTGATLERYRVSTFNQLTPKYRDRSMTKALKIIYSPKLNNIHSALEDVERIQPAFRYGTDLDITNRAMIRDLRKVSERAKMMQEMVEEL